MTETKEKTNKWMVMTPVILRAGCGFMSAITSCIITVIFSLTIYESVLKTGFGYPNAFKILVMIGGPLVSCLQFVNVSSTLAAIFSSLNKEKVEGEAVDPVPIEMGLKAGGSIEQQLYGGTSVLLRAVAGFICCGAICFASLTFTYVIHLGTIAGKELPTEMEMIVVVFGPILTSWSFMKAETTIRDLLKIDGIAEMLRKRAISALTKKDNTQQT